MILRQKVVELLAKQTKLPKTDIDSVLEVPPDPKMGDLAFPCFALSKKQKKSPGEIAKSLRESLAVPKGLNKIEVAGPYLNFFVDDSVFASLVVDKVAKEKSRFGSTNIGKGRKVLIEHTSINPNASPHVGRSRNALIGNSLVNLYRFVNYAPEVHYYVNDIGKQIAMLVLAAGKKKPKFSGLLEMYIKINEELTENPGREKDVFDLLVKLETGDKTVKKQFRDIVDICISGQSKILKQLGINYDHFDYESDYLFSKATNEVLKRLEKKGRIFVDEDNRKVLDLKGYDVPMENPVLVLTRQDGTSLYGLRDLAYTEYKMKRAKKNLFVLGEDQKLYFQQIKAGMDLLGSTAPEVVHYSFVLLKTGKMSTRRGNVVLLEDFMNEVYQKAGKEIKARTRGTVKNAKAIGNAAIIYSLLKVSPEKNVVFDLGKAVSFEGDTGPYLQYTHARTASLLKKSKVKPAVSGNLVSPEEKVILKKIDAFPDTVLKAYENNKPNVIANYLLELAKSFNSYYGGTRILSNNKEEATHRLAISSAVKQTLANGLGLLGIKAVTEM